MLDYAWGFFAKKTNFIFKCQIYLQLYNDPVASVNAVKYLNVTATLGDNERGGV